MATLAQTADAAANAVENVLAAPVAELTRPLPDPKETAERAVGEAVQADAPKAEAPQAEAGADAQPYVVDASSPQRMLIALENNGLFFNKSLGGTDHEAMGAVHLAKTLNRLLRGNFQNSGMSETLEAEFAKLQADTRAEVESKPYAQLVESGRLGEAVVKYNQLLKAKSMENLNRLNSGALKADEQNPALLLKLIRDEKTRIENVERRISTYEGAPDITKAMLLRPGMEALVTCKDCLPLGRAVERSGFVEGAPELVKDLVNDAIGDAVARRVIELQVQIGSEKYIGEQAAKASDPSAQARLQAVALAMRQATRPLSGVHAIEDENPELNRINALETLVSAQVNRAFEQERPATQIAELERQAQGVIQQYAKAVTSLQLEHLKTGAAAGDSRAKAMAANLEKKMNRLGIAPMPAQQAEELARNLAYDSARDLLVSYKGTEAEAKVKTLAQMAGVPEKAPLEAKSTLIAQEIPHPESNIHFIVSPPSASHAERVTKPSAVAVGM